MLRVVEAAANAMDHTLDRLLFSVSSVVGSSSEAMAQKRPKEAVSYAYLYPMALIHVRNAMEEVRSLTGYRIPNTPTLTLMRDVDPFTAANYYKGVIRVLGHRNIRQHIIRHEVFHHAEDMYREQSGAANSEIDFIMKYSMSTGECTQQVACRASWLWNSINESGSYLFQHSQAPDRQNGNAKQAKATLKNIEKFFGFGIEEAAPAVLRMLWSPHMEMQEEILLNGKFRASILPSTLIIGSIIYERNGFDISRTLTQLLRPPQDTMAIIPFDSDEVAKSLGNVISLMRGSS